MMSPCIGKKLVLTVLAMAAFPAPALWQGKFWPHVSRVDNVYGDRNLVCSYPPPEAWKGE